MGFSLGESISAITVFVQGLLSFFSPCVLPLLPLYIGYLAGGAAKTREDGTIDYPRGTVFVNTLCFVVGVSFAFFLLGAGFTALGQFFHDYQKVFSVVSGIIMMAFGLYMLGAFGTSRAIETERRLPFNLNKFAMNPLIALALGFTFSFAWTPCIGPVLTSVLLMAGSSATAVEGFLLVGVYTLGFVLPFLAVGLFTGEVLRLFRTHGSIVKYTVKVGGALLIVMGLFTVTGWMNGVSNFFASVGSGSPAAQEQTATTEEDQSETATQQGADQGKEAEGNAGAADANGEGDQNADGSNGSGSNGNAADADSEGSASDGGTTPKNLPKAPLADVAFPLTNGGEMTFDQFKGKTIFLNFFATWCGPCTAELPDIEALYKEFGENDGDLVVLGVANPNDQNADAYDGPSAELKTFLIKNGVTYPVIMDFDGSLFNAYRIESFPTTVMIDKDGNVFGQAAGALTSDMMHSIVEQTMSGKRP
ncbi:redoxin family protein [Eggerthellaceae bacterium zg-887]|uniref:redoxin family protein n=1 Tax=Xiamenia xianingshaonis TaxID=2682776 RepID=UPI00140BF149|nr:cytochrome c biogenesis protein CcdA [Xiamenia xianingshaonis]NHM15237.1 redoxin family protein [Xiamenia xianingshaonis]